MDESKVLEAIDWIEKAAQSSVFLKKSINSLVFLGEQIRGKRLSEEELKNCKDSIAPFTGTYYKIETVFVLINNEKRTDKKRRFKIVYGMTMPISKWKDIVKLSDDELSCFKNYVPAIPNDWYSVVQIINEEGIELLAVEQHYILDPESNEEMAKAFRGLEEFYEKNPELLNKSERK